MPKLSTHVLDTYHGQPAQGMAYALYHLSQEPYLVTEGQTNPDGRA